MALHARATDLQSHQDVASRIITVASAPAGHPYVARVAADPGVSVLPDPPIAGRPADVWWPPAVLDPVWIDQHRQAADLLHIHFGTESFPPGHLTAVIDAAHAAGWPVVFTAHDLEHPQLGDQAAYALQLEELLRGVDSVVTLTDGAAAVIRERWNREAVVLPHPSVLPFDAIVPRVLSQNEIRVGVHLKDLRPNVDGPGTVRALIESVDRLRVAGVSVEAEVRLQHRVRDERARDTVRALCADGAHTTLIEHERLSDAELVIALSRLDAYVLPYRHGTHSGWLELCWDLGVPVAAPAVGFYAEQHAEGSAAYPPGDSSALAGALHALVAGTQATRAGSVERRELITARRGIRQETDARVAEAQAALYRSLLDRRPR